MTQQKTGLTSSKWSDTLGAGLLFGSPTKTQAIPCTPVLWLSQVPALPKMGVQLCKISASCNCRDLERIMFICSLLVEMLIFFVVVVLYDVSVEKMSVSWTGLVTFYVGMIIIIVAAPLNIFLF